MCAKMYSTPRLLRARQPPAGPRGGSVPRGPTARPGQRQRELQGTRGRWSRLLPGTPDPRPAVLARQPPRRLPARGQPRSDTAHGHPRLRTRPGPARTEPRRPVCSPPAGAASVRGRRRRRSPRSTIWRAAAPQWSSGNRGELHIHGQGWAGGARTGPPRLGRPVPSSASFTAGAARCLPCPHLRPCRRQRSMSFSPPFPFPFPGCSSASCGAPAAPRPLCTERPPRPASFRSHVGRNSCPEMAIRLWKGLPRGAVEPPSPEVFKERLIDWVPG